MARPATKTKKAQVVEEEVDDLEEDEGVEEVDDDDLILDEDDEDDDDLDEIVPPKKRGKEAKAAKRRAPEVTFGVRDLCEYLTEHNDAGKEYKPKDLRNLIRRMAREDDPRVDREIIPGNKARYDWPKGLKDPEVKRIIAAVNKGEIETARKEQLDALKERKAAKDAAGGSKKSKTVKAAAKKKAPVEDEDYDEDFEDDED